MNWLVCLLPIVRLVAEWNLLAPAAPVRAVIAYHHYEDYTANMTLSIDGQPVCQIALRAQQSYLQRECVVDVPATAREMSLSGEFAFTDPLRKGRVRGTQRWGIVDLGPIVSPLRDASRPFGGRVREFVRVQSSVERAHAAAAHEPPLQRLEIKTGESAGVITAAESRLGFPLPPEHVSLLREVGALDIGDSGFMAADTLDRADRQMIKEWGRSKESMAEISPRTTALLRASTILYTEVGDGLGALLYEPALPGRPSACGQQPAYYWIHEDEIDQPSRLTRADGKTCRSYSEAIIWLLAQQVLASWNNNTDLMFVDRSVPTTQRLELSHSSGTDQFRFSLQPRWEMIH